MSANNSKDKHVISYNAATNLLKVGVTVGPKIAKTLQGSIYHGKLMNKDTNKCTHVVIKRANKTFCANKLGSLKDKNIIVPVHENIIKESKIMKYIESLNPPNGFLKFYNLFNDGYNYFLIMEYGGKSLFNHVNSYHKLIKQNKLSINEWKKHVKILFKQLVDMVYFLHNKARICHMDISLENILIKDCEFKCGTFKSHGQVFFCDFGLSEHFGSKNTTFVCKKYVGKTSYKAPEVYEEKNLLMPQKQIYGVLVYVYLNYNLEFNH